MKLNESILKNLTESFPVDFKEFFKDCTTFEELDDKVESDYPNEEDKEWVIDTIDDYADETYRMDNCDDEVWRENESVYVQEVINKLDRVSKM